LNQILKRQTYRSHYGSKAPDVTITVFKYRNKIGKIVVKTVPYSVNVNVKNTFTSHIDKKMFLTFFLTSLSLYIFTIWKCIAYNRFCRDGIYFDKKDVRYVTINACLSKKDVHYIIINACLSKERCTLRHYKRLSVKKRCMLRHYKRLFVKKEVRCVIINACLSKEHVRCVTINACLLKKKMYVTSL
jgi:hypothetical protein